MIITEAIKDQGVRDLVALIHRHPSFSKLRIAFCCHWEKGDSDNATSVEVAQGRSIGINYVFNKIEELATTAPDTKVPVRQAGIDPDLDPTPKRNTK